MNCLNCTNKACKSEARDCTGTREATLELYRQEGLAEHYGNADKLVAGGKAGSLSRIEEIAEYCTLQGHDSIALAYCFSMEDLATEVMNYLTSRGFRVSSYRCTLQGIREKEINHDLGESVSCNPAGQAETINASHDTFVIEMGLCLGHDVMFHQHIKKPFTVFAVKDRVFNNSPQNYFKESSSD